MKAGAWAEPGELPAELAALVEGMPWAGVLLLRPAAAGICPASVGEETLLEMLDRGRDVPDARAVCGVQVFSPAAACPQDMEEQARLAMQDRGGDVRNGGLSVLWRLTVSTEEANARRRDVEEAVQFLEVKARALERMAREVNDRMRAVLEDFPDVTPHEAAGLSPTEQEDAVRELVTVPPGELSLRGMRLAMLASTPAEIRPKERQVRSVGGLSLAVSGRMIQARDDLAVMAAAIRKEADRLGQADGTAADKQRGRGGKASAERVRLGVFLLTAEALALMAMGQPVGVNLHRLRTELAGWLADEARGWPLVRKDARHCRLAAREALRGGDALAAGWVEPFHTTWPAFGPCLAAALDARGKVTRTEDFGPLPSKLAAAIADALATSLGS